VIIVRTSSCRSLPCSGAGSRFSDRRSPSGNVRPSYHVLMLQEVDPKVSVALRNLWQLYRHDLSEYRNMGPEAAGTFPSRPLDAYTDNADRVSFVVRRDGFPIGFVLVHGLEGEARSVGEFFVVRSMRRQGIGLQVALDVFRRLSGRWDVALQEENPCAARFWRRVVAEAAPGRWTEERRQDRTKSFIPPDVWISLTF
jgi:predicted acetyltransferase